MRKVQDEHLDCNQISEPWPCTAPTRDAYEQRLVEMIERMMEVLQDAADHCEGHRQAEEDDFAVPYFPKFLEDKIRAVLCG